MDRIEGDVVVLVPDQDPGDGREPGRAGGPGATVEVARGHLPADVAEGMVLRVPDAGAPADDCGGPVEARWQDARVDAAGTARRRSDAADRLERLKRRDPGGDVVM